MRRLPIEQRQRLMSRGRAVGIRHGSNVPGPLEARRRSSRRRFGASLLSPTGGVLYDEGAVLFPPKASQFPQRELPGRPDGTANVSKGTEFQQLLVYCCSNVLVDAWLPSWLVNASDGPSPETPRPTQSKKPSSWPPMLKDRQSLDETVSLGTEERVSMNRLVRSRYVFGRLCTAGAELTTFLELLSNKDLNAPGAGNLRLLVSKLGHIFGFDRRPLAQRQQLVLKLSRWLEQEACLGNIAESDMRVLVKWLADNASSSSHDAWYLRRLSESLARGLLKCTIRPLCDLESSTMEQLLRALSRCPSIASDVIAQIRPDDRSHIVSSYIQVFISGKDADSDFDSFFGLTSKYCSKEQISQLVEQAHSIASLSPRHARWLKRCISQPFIMEVLSKEDLILYTQNLPSFRVGDYAMKTPPTLHPQFVHCTPVDGCKLLTELWLLPHAHSILTSKDQLRIGSKICTSMHDLRAIVHEQLNSRSMDSELIPYTALMGLANEISPELASQYTHHMVTTFTNTSNYATLYLLVKHSQKLRVKLVDTVIQDAINEIALWSPRRALSLFMNDPSLTLNNFLPLAAAITASPTLPTEILLSLLARSGKFPTGLPRLEAKTENIEIVLMLIRMVVASQSRHTYKLVLVSRILDFFAGSLDAYTPEIMSLLIKGEVLHCFRGNGRLSDQNYRKTLKHVAKAEGKEVGHRLRHMMVLWQSRQAENVPYLIED